MTVLQEAAPAAAERMQPGQSGRLRAFWGAKGILRQAHGPGWALVGDAGYFKDPMTSHGISDAFRDAELLAQAVAQGTDAALAEYQATRDRLSADLFEITEQIAGFDWSMEEIPKLLEGLSAAMKAELAHLATSPAASEPNPSAAQAA